MLDVLPHLHDAKQPVGVFRLQELHLAHGLLYGLGGIARPGRVLPKEHEHRLCGLQHRVVAVLDNHVDLGVLDPLDPLGPPLDVLLYGFLAGLDLAHLEQPLYRKEDVLVIDGDALPDEVEDDGVAKPDHVPVLGEKIRLLDGQLAVYVLCYLDELAVDPVLDHGRHLLPGVVQDDEHVYVRFTLPFLPCGGPEEHDGPDERTVLLEDLLRELLEDVYPLFLVLYLHYLVLLLLIGSLHHFRHLPCGRRGLASLGLLFCSHFQ